MNRIRILAISLLLTVVLLIGIPTAFARTAPAVSGERTCAKSGRAIMAQPMVETGVPIGGLLQNCVLLADVAPGPSGDGVVNLDDIVFIAGLWRDIGKYKVEYDLAPPGSPDGVINILDIQYVAGQYGETCGPLPWDWDQPSYGVQMFGEVTDPVTQTMAVGAGVRWVRMYAEWRGMEPVKTDPPTYHFGGLDNQIREATQAGLIPQIVVQNNPNWAVDRNGDGGADYSYRGPMEPFALPRFAQFMAAMVERYDGDGLDDMPDLRIPIKYYEFGNEQDANFCLFGACWGADADSDGVPDPVEYAEMLTAIYGPMHQADPDVQVVFGGVAAIYLDYQGQPKFNQNFTDEVLAELASDPQAAANNFYFDVMNFHHYDFRRDASDGSLPFDQGLAGKAAMMRNILAQYGLQNKPMISTEFGLHVGWYDPANPPSNDLLEKQASYVVHEFVRGMASGLDIIMWFSWKDFSTNDYRYGVLDLEGHPRPAYHAVDLLTDQLAGQSYATQTQFSDNYVQAYRFNGGGQNTLVVWTDNGTKIKSQSSISRSLTLNSSNFPGETWTGYLWRTYLQVDASGNAQAVTQRIGTGGSSVSASATQVPIFLKVAPQP